MIVAILAVAAVVLVLLLLIGKVPLSYNLRNLTVRWKTTIMTALAFTAVIALLTVMMAFVNGMQRLTNGTGQPGNVLVLSDGATDEIISNLTVGDLSDIENLPEVLRENGRPMTSRETFLVANQPVPGTGDGRPKRHLLQVRGVEDPPLTARCMASNSCRAEVGSPGRACRNCRPAAETTRLPCRWFKPSSARVSLTSWPAAAPRKSGRQPKSPIASRSAIPSFSATGNGSSWAS